MSAPQPPAPDLPATNVSIRSTAAALRIEDVRVFRLACDALYRGTRDSIRDVARRLRDRDPECGVSASGIHVAERRLLCHYCVPDGVRLFHVTGDGVHGLTETGELILTRCKHVMAALEFRPAAQPREHLVIATAGSVLHDVVPAAVAYLKSGNESALTMLFDTFVPGRFADQLAEGRADMGVAWHGGTDAVPASRGLVGASRLNAEPLTGPTGICVLLPRGHPLLAGGAAGALAPSRLTNQTVIYPPLRPIRSVARGLPSVRRVRVADFPAVARQVSTGLGIGLFPDHPVHTRPATRLYGLRAVSLDVPVRLQLCVYTRQQEAPLDPALAAVRDALEHVVHESTRESLWQAVAPAAFDQTDWTGEWYVSIESEPQQFRTLVARGRTDGGLRLLLSEPAAAYTGHVAASAACFLIEEGNAPLSLTLVRAARHATKGTTCFAGHATHAASHGPPSVVRVFFSRTRLSPSDQRAISDLLDS